MENRCIYTNSVVSLEEFNDYTNNYEDSEGVVRLKIQYIQAAQQVVESYLNYKLESGLYVDFHIGFNNTKFYFNSKPVTNVISVQVNKQELEDYDFDRESFWRTDDGLFRNHDSVMVEYETNIVQACPLIKQTILRIAALMLTEADGNIGITSKGATDGMSRTYVSYNNYQKYLDPLKDYRIFRL